MNPAHEEDFLDFLRQRTGSRQVELLDALCREDVELRQRLESRLAAGHEGLTRVDPDRKREPGGDAPPSAAAPAPTGIVSDEGVGQTLGRFKLLEQIGEGGCGVVYVAEQIEPVRRRVAVKVIKLGMDTKAVVARFEAERQALAMMDHPNIAKVFDAGTTSTGRPYFVMELVRGIRITEFCDRSQLSTKDRLALGIKVCKAIQHAHQKGIVHRDIKPSNILVTQQDGVPTPKVIDFGIAKATEGRLTDATIYTQIHQFIGTPTYMSPEQADGDGLDIDTRSDIYSLGVLLYELLTGKTPIDAKALLAQGLDSIRRTIREEDPPPPSTRLAGLPRDEQTTTAKCRSSDTARLLHQLRGDLDWIVMKCLEKDRTRRYETANGLAADLERHLRHEPVLARPASSAYRFKKAVQRNKLAFSAGALVFLALAVGIAVSSWQASRALRAESLARERLTEAEAIATFLTEVFHSPNPERDGRTITVAEALGAAAQKVDTDLIDQPRRRAKLQAALGETYHGLGFYREAIQQQQAVRAYYLNASGLEHPETLMAMHKLANTYAAAGRDADALKLRKEVVELRRKVLGPEHSDTLVAMINLAASYAAEGRLAEALTLEENTLRMRRRISGPEDPDTIAAMANLASSYFDADRKAEALALHEKVVALSRKVHGPEHPATLLHLSNLAVSYSASGRVKEAFKLREETLALYRKRLGPEHPESLMVLTDLGVSYRENGLTNEAVKIGQSSVDLYRRISGLKHPETLNAMTELAISLRVALRIPEASRLEEETLALKRQHLGPKHPWTLESMENLAACYEISQRLDEAEALRRQITEMKAQAVRAKASPPPLEAITTAP